MTAAVMGDAAISARGEEEHLVFESVRAERPSVAEDHRRSGAPVLVVNLRAVFGCERAHVAFSLGCGGVERGHSPGRGRRVATTFSVWPHVAFGGAADLDHGDAASHCLSHLVEGAHLDLAHALARD